MPVALIPSFLFYCFINGITPGPANLCSLSAAMKYGRKAALRQWRGLFCGFAVIAVAAVFFTAFLGQYFQRYVQYFSLVGAAYLLWLALHFLRDDGTARQGDAAQCGFRTGFLVQMFNVKVMVFCVTALGAYLLPYRTDFFSLLAVGLFLPFTGPVANLVWLFAGASLQTVFQNHARVINCLMAASLVLCAASLLLSSSLFS